MPNARIVNAARKLKRARTTNATDTSFASKVPTVTRPSGEGVVDIRKSGYGADELILIPFGTGDADDVFDMKVIGWKQVGDLWIPVPLLLATCTLGTAVGVDGEGVDDSEKFCDTVTASFGVSNVSYQLFSPTNNTVAHIRAKANGFDLVEFCFEFSTNDPTGANCLYAAI